jgi:6-pyruvoyltetrahydropterin/6-carboxytetrahydropterin synthase
MITANRYHDISVGHRVVGHENKCRHLHGHNLRIHFTCQAEQLDSLGRVIDFSQIKSRLCMWLEDYWDHKFLAWENDPVLNSLSENCLYPSFTILDQSFVFVPFNPTAENIAKHLVEVIGPQQLAGTGITLTKVVVEETAKCSATYSI